MSKLRLAVLFGGQSPEHEISVITALQAISAIDTLKYEIIPVYVSMDGRWYTGDGLFNKAFYKQLPKSLSSAIEVTLLPDPTIKGLTVRKGKQTTILVDCYFLAFHGLKGEDGDIQGLLELAGAAYTGSNLIGSALSMDKGTSTRLAAAAGIPVLPTLVVERKQGIKLRELIEKITATPGLNQYPLFLKPNNLGSSIGISKVNTQEELGPALAHIFSLDTAAVVQPAITHIMEINCSVMDGNPPRASVIEIPVSSAGILTYEDKYLRGGKKTGQSAGDAEGMASLTRDIDSKTLDPAYKEKIRKLAVKIFETLGCSGVARIDFIVDTSTNQLYFNELNAIPGSLSFYLWDHSHPPMYYPDLIDHLVETALYRQASQSNLNRQTSFVALKRF